MRTKNILYIIAAFVLIFNSCELLNYDGPNAQFHGALIDEETGDTIPQDIIGGSVIDFIEQGFKVPETQKLIIKVDGTFRDNLMFSADYKMFPARGNFFVADTISIHLDPGDNKYDFQLTPYCRINDVQFKIVNQGGNNFLVANFKIDQIAAEPVKSIMLAIDRNPNVGRRFNESFFERPVDKVVDPDEEQFLWLLLSNFIEGDEYYIRLGALIDIPEAKYNWNKAIKLDPHTLLMP